jgi:hypothetical protein
LNHKGLRHLRFKRWLPKLAFGWPLLAVVLLLAGCNGARIMMPTPNVHLDPKRNFFADLVRDLKSTEVKLFYITNRAPEQDEKGNLHYGYSAFHMT